jgi:hypothetical protein
MYTIKIAAAEKMRVQETGEHMLSVLFNILKEGELVVEMRHGFPLETSVQFLEIAARSILALYISEKDRDERNAEFNAQDKQADETIAGAVGKEITN